jgi:heme/copper-type cytochrome/quinol oxidase subunit 4
MPESRFKLFWNLVVVFLLSYTATVVPFRTAFVDTSSTFMFWFELIIDILFGLDLFINMISAVDLDS